MKCNNKYYQIADLEGGYNEFQIIVPILTSAIVNGEEQAPKVLSSADGLVVREIVGDETGIGKVITDWSFENGDFEIIRQNYPAKSAKFTIRGCIGNARVDATLVVNIGSNEEYSEYEFPDYVVKYISDGEGGDFKTNEYYDADSRLLMVREDDGSTTIYDEHENPIIKRLAGGTTQIFDASQSVRFQIGPHGGMLVNVPDENDITFGSHAAVIIGSGEARAEGVFINGTSCTAIGECSHAEGVYTTSRGFASHTEGDATVADNNFSHAEGISTGARGECSHAEGQDNIALNSGSHAEGFESHAEGDYSHTEGWGTKTVYDDQHAQGTFNFPDECDEVDGAFMHGCGSDDDRKNAFIIKGSEIYVFGVGGYDGTNSNDPNVKSLRQVLQAIQVKLVNVPS